MSPFPPGLIMVGADSNAAPVDLYEHNLEYERSIVKRIAHALLSNRSSCRASECDFVLICAKGL